MSDGLISPSLKLNPSAKDANKAIGLSSKTNHYTNKKKYNNILVLLFKWIPKNHP